MKSAGVIALVILTGIAGLAQETDRAVDAGRIRSIVGEMNRARRASDARAFSQLFARNGALKVGNEAAVIGPGAIERAARGAAFWSEVTPAVLEIQWVTFPASDLAFVDATQTQYGSVILKQVIPVTLLIEFDGTDWRILSMRIRPAFGFVH